MWSRSIVISVLVLQYSVCLTALQVIEIEKVETIIENANKVKGLYLIDHQKYLNDHRKRKHLVGEVAIVMKFSAFCYNSFNFGLKINIV